MLIKSMLRWKHCQPTYCKLQACIYYSYEYTLGIEKQDKHRIGSQKYQFIIFVIKSEMQSTYFYTSNFCHSYLCSTLLYLCPKELNSKFITKSYT